MADIIPSTQQPPTEGGMIVDKPTWLTAADDAAANDTSFRDNAGSPVIKIVQGNASPEIAKKFTQGQVIISPLDILVAERDSLFEFAPLTAFKAYNGWYPRQRPAGCPPFKEVSLDPKSQCAAKARAFYSTVDQDPGPGTGLEVKYRETMCFVVYPLNIPDVDMPCVMMFGSTNFKNGQNLAGYIESQRKRGVPPYAQIWYGKTEMKSGNGNTWYVMPVEQPKGKPTCIQDKALGEKLRDLAGDAREQVMARFAATQAADADAATGADDTEY